MNVDIAYDISYTKIQNQNTNTTVDVPPAIPVVTASGDNNNEPAYARRYGQVSIDGTNLYPRTMNNVRLPASTINGVFRNPFVRQLDRASDIEAGTVQPYWSLKFFNPRTDSFVSWSLTPMVITIDPPTTGDSVKKFLCLGWRNGGNLPEVNLPTWTEAEMYIGGAARVKQNYRLCYCVEYDSTRTVGANIALSNASVSYEASRARPFVYNPFSSNHIVGTCSMVLLGGYYATGGSWQEGISKMYAEVLDISDQMDGAYFPYQYDYYASTAEELALNAKKLRWKTQNWIKLDDSALSGAKYIDQYTMEWDYNKQVDISADEPFT